MNYSAVNFTCCFAPRACSQHKQDAPASGSTVLTNPPVANASFREDINCGTAWGEKKLQRRRECCNMLLRHFNEALVLYICASAVCTLGILQDNGPFLSWQVCLVGKHCFECSLFNAVARLCRPPPAEHILFREQFKSLWQTKCCDKIYYVQSIGLFQFSRRWYFVDVPHKYIFVKRSDFYVCLSFNQTVLYYWNDDLWQQKCWPALLEKYSLSCSEKLYLQYSIIIT